MVHLQRMGQYGHGKNNCGQLGDETTENKLTPIQIEVFTDVSLLLQE